MADVIVNNPGGATLPAQTNDTSNGMGFVLGVLLLLAVILFVVWYGLPRIAASVNVPRSVDVNVNVPNYK